MPAVLRAPRVKRTQGRQSVYDSQPSFKDGLNTVSNDYAVLSTQMRLSNNVRLDAYGAATKRGGTQRTASALAGTTLRGGYGWRKDSSTFYTLAMCNGSLFSTTYGTFPLTWTNQGGTFTASAYPSFAGFRDASANVVYVATGGTLKKFTGAAITSCANAVQASGICVYHDRLWGWGVSGTLDSIYYSNLSGASASTGGDSLGYVTGSGGQIIVRTFGQQDIVAAAPVNTSLLIWHKRGISRITGFGNSDITVSPEAVTADVGLVGQDAVTIYDNLAYFVSERGVYKANEASVMPLGTTDKPDPVLPQLLTLSSANLARIVCRYNRATREVWVQLPGIGIYIYHTVLESWSGPFIDGYLSPDTTALFETVDASNQPIMLRGDTSGYASLCDATTTIKDNVVSDGTGGTAFDASVQCHRMFCGDPTTANGYRWINLLASPLGASPVTVSWNTISAADSFVLSTTAGVGPWGSGTWGAGTWGIGGMTPFYIPCSGYGPYIDVIITDSGTALAQYVSVDVEAFPYGQR